MMLNEARAGVPHVIMHHIDTDYAQRCLTVVRSCNLECLWTGARK